MTLLSTMKRPASAAVSQQKKKQRVGEGVEHLTTQADSRKKKNTGKTKVDQVDSTT